MYGEGTEPMGTQSVSIAIESDEIRYIDNETGNWTRSIGEISDAEQSSGLYRKGATKSLEQRKTK